VKGLGSFVVLHWQTFTVYALQNAYPLCRETLKFCTNELHKFYFGLYHNEMFFQLISMYCYFLVVKVTIKCAVSVESLYASEANHYTQSVSSV